MAESIPVDPAPCPVDVTSVPPSSVESDTFVFMEKTNPNQVFEKLNRLRLNNTLCDVILCCGGKQFPCHRTVLASFSSYFEKMFTTGMMESKQEKVDMMDVEPQEIDLLVGYAYTLQLIISSDNVKALLAASNLLGVTAVQEACCHYMERQMDMKNCVGIHCFAELHSCKMLMKHSMDYILEHFSEVYQQKEFLSLSVDKLTEIVASDDLNVSKEELVFEAAMLWLSHCPTRTQSFEKVMEHIRLAFISESYLKVTASLSEVESQVCQRLSEVQNHRPRRSTDSHEVILMLGGGEPKNPCLSMQVFHSMEFPWRTLTSCLPLAVWSPGLVGSGSMLYLAGGKLIDGSISREMWRYDTFCDSWLKMAPMNEARWDYGLVMLDGSMYAVGGFRGQLDKWKSVDRYDFNTNMWQLMDSVGLPDHWDGFAVVALDGLIYAVGHINDPKKYDMRKLPRCPRKSVLMFKYNPQTSAWTETARPCYHRIRYSAACALRGLIYVIGGEFGVECGASPHVTVYDPQTDQWNSCASMRMMRVSPSVVVMDKKIYVLGGSNRPNITSHRPIEQYDDKRGWWVNVGERPSRGEFSCVSVWLRKDPSERVERKPQEKQIPCTNCNRGFSSKGGLRTHSRYCKGGQSTQPQYRQSDRK